jgi:hypothetical protein
VPNAAHVGGGAADPLELRRHLWVGIRAQRHVTGHGLLTDHGDRVIEIHACGTGLPGAFHPDGDLLGRTLQDR